MPKAKMPHFFPHEFTPTQFSTAEDKARFANHLMDFILSGFPKHKFVKWFYVRVRMCFGFIAHYNQGGFWSEYFETAEDKARFIRRIMEYSCFGDPAFCDPDVERAVQKRLAKVGFPMAPHRDWLRS